MEQQLYKGYPLPRTNEQEVLLTLIIYGNVSIFDHPYQSGFRTRVSDIQIKHGVFLQREKKTKTNKFGNTYTYAKHILPESEKQKAIEIYYKINKESSAK